MKILILGAAGFLGARLTRALLNKGQLSINGQASVAIQKIVAFDKQQSKIGPDSRLEIVEGDISKVDVMEQLLNQKFDLIYHLAAIVSGEAEKNFELGMGVNLHAIMNLLEQCRLMQDNPVLVYASSCAVYGGELTEVIRDNTATTPMSSYGTQKAIGGLLINDYSRRGFVNGRSLRLPTIAIRPGKANAATSSFVSSIVRDTLEGRRANCPVPKETKVWILSPKKVTEAFIHAATLSQELLGANRMIPLAGITVSIQDMVNALRELAGDQVVDRIDWHPDEFLRSIVLTWPPNFVTDKAIGLGFKADDNVKEIIQSFIDNDMVDPFKQ